MNEIKFSPTVEELLALPGVSVEDSDSTTVVAVTADGEMDMTDCDGFSGVYLLIGEGVYGFTDDQGWTDTTITYGKLREENLTSLVTQMYADDEVVDRDELVKPLRDYLHEKRAEAVEAKERGIAHQYAALLMEHYEDAAGFVKFHPRSFGNEYTIYAYRSTDKDKLQKRMDNYRKNEDWRDIDPDEIMKMVERSEYYARKEDSLERELADHWNLEWWEQPHVPECSPLGRF